MRQGVGYWVIGIGFPMLLAACTSAGGVGREPVRASQPVRGKALPVVSQASSWSMLDAVSVSATPLPGRALTGTVSIPARWSGGQIVGNNGGSIVGSGAGHLVSNNGSSVVSHNGGTLGPLGDVEVPLAFAMVSMRDATGAILNDVKGQPLVTQTDARGRYAFAEWPAGVHGIVTVQVPGQPQPLLAFVPKDSAGVSRAVDLVSTLVMTYLQARFINGKQAAFAELDPALVEQAQAWLVGAIARKGIVLPDTLTEANLVALIDQLRADDPQAQAIYERVRAQLVLVGGVAQMQGRDRLDFRLDEASAVLRTPDGGFYVFERPKHLLWYVTPDGRVELALAGPQWGYGSQAAPANAVQYPSVMVHDGAGRVYVADTWNHRVVRYSHEGGALVVAGDGKTDGGRSLKWPTGLALTASGQLVIADTGHGRLCRLNSDGSLETLSVTGGEPLAEPMGIMLEPDGAMLVAEYGGNRLLRVAADGVTRAVVAIDRPTALVRRGDGGYAVISAASGQVMWYPGGQAELLPDADMGRPRALWADANGVYVGASGVWKLGEGGARVLGATRVQLRESGQFLQGRSLAVAPEGRVYLSDAGGHTVFVHGGGQTRVYAGTGAASGGVAVGDRLSVTLPEPAGVLVDALGNCFVLTGGQEPGVVRVGVDGQVIRLSGADTAPVTPGETPVRAQDLVAWQGALCAWLEPSHGRIRVQGMNGGPVSAQGAPGVVRMGNGPDHGVWVLDARAGELREWNGQRVWLRASALAPWFGFDQIRAVAFGEGDRCYVASANSIVMVTGGHITAVAGHHTVLLNGQEPDSGLFDIQDLAWMPSEGLFVLESTQLKRIPKSLLPAH